MVGIFSLKLSMYTLPTSCKKVKPLKITSFRNLRLPRVLLLNSLPWKFGRHDSRGRVRVLKNLDSDCFVLTEND